MFGCRGLSGKACAGNGRVGSVPLVLHVSGGRQMSVPNRRIGVVEGETQTPYFADATEKPEASSRPTEGAALVQEPHGSEGLGSHRRQESTHHGTDDPDGCHLAAAEKEVSDGRSRPK